MAEQVENRFTLLHEASKKFTQAMGLHDELILEIFRAKTDWEFTIKIDAMLEAAAKAAVPTSFDPGDLIWNWRHQRYLVATNEHRWRADVVRRTGGSFCSGGPSQWHRSVRSCGRGRARSAERWRRHSSLRRQRNVRRLLARQIQLYRYLGRRKFGHR
jgi:hypothetical protein